MPPMTDTGVDAPMPAKRRNMTRLAKFGASADAITNAENTVNVQIIMIFRPYDSLNGAKIIGPKMYPIRYMLTGNTSNSSEVTWKYFCTTDVAPDGKELPIVLLTTINIPVMTTYSFFGMFQLYGLVLSSSSKKMTRRPSTSLHTRLRLGHGDGEIEESLEVASLSLSSCFSLSSCLSGTNRSLLIGALGGESPASA
jgi:hypothetical protein